MPAYYNEFDPKAAAWLRELIAAELIPDGIVDERSICDVQGKDLEGFEQVHFFAGIGGWAKALEIASWPTDAPVWTGSCPCPPFSSAGKKKLCPECEGKPIPHPLKTGIFACIECGHEWLADERHLWPEFLRIIEECRPATIFGEQVAGPDGQVWLAGVRLTLEALGYGVGGSDLCAAGIGAPHIRQRLFWVADSRCGIVRDERQPVDGKAKEDQGEEDQRQRVRADIGDGGSVSGMVQPHGSGRKSRRASTEAAGHGDSSESASCASRLAYTDGRFSGNRELQSGGEHGQQPQDGGTGGRVGDAAGERREGSADGITDAHDQGDGPQRHAAVAGCNGSGFWDAFDLVPCRDGKWRRVPARGAEPGLQLLADGLPAGLGGMWVEGAGVHPLAVEKVEGRVGLLRGFGNAIVPEVAAAFIRAYRECKS